MTLFKLLSAALLFCCIACKAQTTNPTEKCTAECCKEKSSIQRSKTKIKPTGVMETEVKSKVVACKLTSPEMQKRREEVLALLKEKVKEKEELKDGYKYKFEGTAQILDQVVAFIKSERACCDFFTFGLTVSDDKSNIWLTITGPDGAKDFIKMEMDL